jgi:Ca-activated chloride channel family protein
MHFAAPLWLLGAGFALVVAILLLLGGIRAARAVGTFGDEALVRGLMTADPATRRAWKGVLLVIATALCFVAAARPQYGKGTKLIPATNIDVVLVLDYSKSMYAQDVEPSRIFRAKLEIARLVKQLRGARFAAVAFAGEPMGFPLTADGAAIAQFLRQLEPNDMPVGGTAIARALSYARNMLERDPKSKDHKRVIVLVTDGEDLEGDPVSVARAIGADGTTIHVVQIGGRTPEPIPEVDEQGRVAGFRRSRDGQPLTTALTVDGEQQLGQIALGTPGGRVVRAAEGTTGIEEITQELRRQMTSELGERVETVYADIYFIPLGLAIALLVAEVFLGEARRRTFRRSSPPPARRPMGAGRAARMPAATARGASSLRTRIGSSPSLWLGLVLACLGGAVGSAATGCSGWEPSEPFERDSPAVNEAIRLMDSGQFDSAEQVLESYLGTGPCGDGGLGLPPTVRDRPNGSFDLGLTLFYLGETFGRRFGEEGQADADPEAEILAAQRSLEIDCAQIVVEAIAADPKVPVDLRARAYYLSGNLEFLRADYEKAVRQYDQALGLVPGMWPEAGPSDEVGRDAAWNRAIALRRISEQQDAGSDADAEADGGDDADADAEQPDARPDGSDDAGEDDGGGDAGAEDGGKDGGAPDSGNDDGGEPAPSDGGAKDGGDAGAEDASTPPPQPQDEPEPQPQPGANDSQRDRVLDQLEQAPTYQEEEAKKRIGVRPRYRMEDK